MKNGIRSLHASLTVRLPLQSDVQHLISRTLAILQRHRLSTHKKSTKKYIQDSASFQSDWIRFLFYHVHILYELLTKAIAIDLDTILYVYYEIIFVFLYSLFTMATIHFAFFSGFSRLKTESRANNTKPHKSSCCVLLPFVHARVCVSVSCRGLFFFRCASICVVGWYSVRCFHFQQFSPANLRYTLKYILFWFLVRFFSLQIKSSHGKPKPIDSEILQKLS